MRHRDLTSPKSWPPRSTTAPKRSLTDLTHPPRHPRPVVIAHPAGAHVGQLMRASADSSRITISDFLISSEKMTLASACLIEQDGKGCASSDAAGAPCPSLPPPRWTRSVEAVTVGSDAANPDAAIPVARSGHDLAAKPGDRRHAPSDQRTGRAPARAPCALKPSRRPTLRMTTDTSCDRGRFDLNRRVFAATA